MIIYTPLPMEIVLEETQSAPAPRFKKAFVGGIPVVVEETAPGRGRLVRLLSTDPFDYLNPALTPGREVSFPETPF